MMMEVPDDERWTLQRLRLIKAEQGGRGHGTLRVDVVDGIARIAKRELSDKYNGPGLPRV